MESPDATEKKDDLDNAEPDNSHGVVSSPIENRSSSSPTGSLVRPTGSIEHPSSVFPAVPSARTEPILSSNAFTSEVAGESATEQVAPHGEVGATKMRYQYDQVKNDYEASSKHLQETVIKTVLRLMEIHKNSPNLDMKISEFRSMGTIEPLKDLEKEVKSVGRRIAESRRERDFALSEINNLELRMMKEQELALIRELLDKIPTEEDLKKISRVQALINERRQLEREIEKLKSGVNAMNKAMANVDVVISDCSAIKRQRKVVILANQADSVSKTDAFSSEHVNEGSPEADEENSAPPDGSPP